MKRISLLAPAKLNLILEVLARRPDGYHEIRTVMHGLELADRILLTPSRRGLVVTCDDPQVPEGEANLAFRAARLLALRTRQDPKVRVHIQKRIPVAAGLGGGSSDAAAVLLGLAQWWGIRRPRLLLALAKQLGSDVPFFLRAGCQLGTGRGECLRPWPEAPGLPVVLLNPGFGVSTAAVYKKASLHLTTKNACINMMRRAVVEKNTIKIGENLVNQLEPVTSSMHPEVQAMRQDLLRGGALAARMSGSGPTVFGLMASWSQGQALVRQLRGRYPVVRLTRLGAGRTG